MNSVQLTCISIKAICAKFHVGIVQKACHRFEGGEARGLNFPKIDNMLYARPYSLTTKQLSLKSEFTWRMVLGESVNGCKIFSAQFVPGFRRYFPQWRWNLLVTMYLRRQIRVVFSIGRIVDYVFAVCIFLCSLQLVTGKGPLLFRHS